MKKVKKEQIEKYIEASRDFFDKNKITSEELIKTGCKTLGAELTWERQLIDVLALMKKGNETIYKVLKLVGLEIEYEHKRIK